MPSTPIIPIVDITTLSCRDGNFRCRLGSMGCSSIQISGQPASYIDYYQTYEMRCPNPVPTVKPGQYDVMIIGDLPSVSDDRMDLVWSDNSGGQVIEFLKKAGHDLDRIWMTKISKCRPNVKGRKPTPSEINVCRDEHLRKEIELIQPKVVMLVGSPSLRAFNLLGKGSLNAIHGRVFEAKFANWDDGPVFKVVPTVNPATFFYRPNKKLQARIGHDYLVVKDLLDGKEISDYFVPKWHLINTPEKLEWLKDKLLNSILFGWDTESCGLSFRKDPVLSFQFAWGWDDCAVIPINEHDPNAPKDQQFHILPSFGAKNETLVTEFMKDVFKTPHIAKSAHYHKHDLNVLRWCYGVKAEGFLYDTWTMKHLMDESKPSDLEFLCDLEFAWGDYGVKKRKVVGSGKKLKATFDKITNEDLWPYGATDALGTYRLTCVYADRLTKNHHNLWKFHQIESEPIQRSLAKAEYKGALIHLGAMDILRKKFEKDQKSLLTKMRKVTAKPEFNPRSDKQVLAAFSAMGVLDVDLEEKSNVSGYSTGKNKLNDLVEKGKQPQADFAANLMTYRNRVKMISTYLENCKEDLDSDGRVRYSWVIAGPVTGRLSCRFFHQIPKIDDKIVCYGPPGPDGKPTYVPFTQRLKDKRLVMRDMFIAPKGYKYVYGDFSQIELRIVAIISNDKEMILILSDPNGDLHAITAYEFIKTQWPGMVETDVSKVNRAEVGKRINFGLIYGCFAAGTRILMSNGEYKDIEQIVEGDKVINMYGNPVKVKRAFCTGLKKVIKVKTSLSGKDTIVTPNHLFYSGDLSTISTKSLQALGYKKALNSKAKITPKSTKLKWMEIGTEKKHVNLIPRTINFELSKMFCINLRKGIKRQALNIKPSYELGYIFGTFLGDGTARYTKNKGGIVTWTFGKNEENIANKLNICLSKVLARSGNISKIKNTLLVSLSDSAFGEFLLSFGKKDNKHLPSNYLIQDIKYLTGIKDGLIDSDGCRSNNNITFSNTSLKLIENYNIIIYLLTGIWPNVSKKIQNSNLVKNTKPVYTSYILKTKSKRLLEKHQIVKVLNKSKEEECLVYDLEIEDNTHSFIANNSIVHNSEGYNLVKTGKWYDHNNIERNITWDMLNQGMAAWKARFKGVGNFIDTTPDKVRAMGGVATNVFGRERHFGTILNSPNDGECRAAERECINFFVQSVATSITNRTIIAVDKMLDDFGIGDDIVCMVNTVHDSIAYEVRDDHVDWFMEALKAVSQVPYPELGGATFKIDCAYGQNWTDAEMRA